MKNGLKMSIIKFKKLLPYCFFLICYLNATIATFSQTLIFSDSLSSFPTISISPDLENLAIHNQVHYWIDSSRSKPIAFIKKQAFQPYSYISKPVILNQNYAYWWQFSIQNISEKDSLKALLCTTDCSNIELYPSNQKDMAPLRGGDFCSLHNRAFEPNDLCFPIAIAPTKKINYFLKTYDFETNKHNSFHLALKSYQRELVDRKITYSTLLPKYVLFSLFSGIMFFLILYASFQYWATKDKAFFYYGAYLFVIIIYYLRNYEAEIGWSYPILFTYIMEWNKHLEVPIMYSSFILYILFVIHFLNLGKINKNIHQFLHYSVWGIGILITVDILLQCTVGLRASFTIHHYTRLLLFIPSFFFIISIVFLLKNRLSKYVIIGVLFLLLGALFSVFTKIAPGQATTYLGGVFKIHHTGNISIPMYGMKIGILLEMICFAFGLSYKNKLRKQGLERLGQKIQQQQQQIRNIVSQANQRDVIANPFLERISELLEQNFTNPNFSTQALADHLNTNRSNLYRQFKTHIKQSPSEYIRQFRLEKARQLLLNSTLSISQIAYQTGFKEVSHFSKSFKDFYKITPSTLRLQP